MFNAYSNILTTSCTIKESFFNEESEKLSFTFA